MCDVIGKSALYAAAGAIVGGCIAGPAGFIGAGAGAFLGAIDGALTRIIYNLSKRIFGEMGHILYVPIAYAVKVSMVMALTPLTLPEAFLFCLAISGIAYSLGFGISVITMGSMIACKN